MNISKFRDIQAKMPSPKVIYASNESKSVLARNLEECRDNDKNSQSVILSFKCILARNREGTEQLLLYEYFIASYNNQCLCKDFGGFINLTLSGFSFIHSCVDFSFKFHYSCNYIIYNHQNKKYVQFLNTLKRAVENLRCF